MYYDKTWSGFFESDQINSLIHRIDGFLNQEKEKSKVIFPPETEVFRVFHLCKLTEIKVVILGQDPYHQIYQANGLAFSVNKGIKIPPSLINIFKAIKNQFPDFQIPNHGDLLEWAQQGVFLLNSSLTVESGKPGSHSKIGWTDFTDAVVKEISQKLDKVVFLLWGSHAQSKSNLIDDTKHLVLKTSHPSPLSAYQGFLTSNQFLETNIYLKQSGKAQINWQIHNEQFKLF